MLSIPLANATPKVTPAEVRAARIILLLQGALLVGIGFLLAGVDDAQVATWFPTVSMIEGALRMTLAGTLRRGARVTWIVTLVVSVPSAIIGFMAGGVSLLGAVLAVVVVRCLCTDAAKQHFAA